MRMMAIKHVVCLILAATVTTLGAAGCVATVPPEDDRESEPTPGSAENVGEAAQAVQCGYQGPPAHCMGSCWSNPGAWVDLGNPGAGNCTQMVQWYCSSKGGKYGACWGYP